MLLKFKKFMILPWYKKYLFIEAFITLGIMRAGILTITFKKMTNHLTMHKELKVLPILSKKENILVRELGQSIRHASIYTPWESACLAQSLTAQRMLARRNIAGVFYLGVCKDDNSSSKMKAHSWTQSGAYILTGKIGHNAFTILSIFSWEKK